MRKLFRKKRREGGFSILEVTLYSTMLLGGLAATYQLINSSALSRRKMKQFLGYAHFYNYVLSVVSNQNNCGVGFGILTPNYGTGNADRNATSVKLSPGDKTQISLYSPIGEKYNVGVAIGALTISDLSLSLGSSSRVVPGTGDRIYSATLLLAAKKSSVSLVSVQPLSLPLSVRLNPSNEMVSCSSYRTPNQKLLTSPPCDQYSVASLSADGNSVLCKKVLCPNGTLPVDYDANGQVTCSSVQASCTGSSQGLVNVKGQYLCKQLTCADPKMPLSWPVSATGATDPDGFSNGCTNLNSILISCQKDSNIHCYPLSDPQIDPGAYLGYFCPTTSPGNQYKICTEDCTHKNPSAAGSCPLVVPSDGSTSHLAAECLLSGGLLANDPAPDAASGGLVCAFVDNSPQGQKGCPAGWKFYGKTYAPNPASCSQAANDLAFSLDWHGRSGCWPNCAGQGDSFPAVFGDSTGALCRQWLIDNKYYSENSDGTIKYPAQGTFPSGYKSAVDLAAAGTPLGINASTFGCYKQINCRLCGQPGGTSMSGSLDTVSSINGIDLTLTNSGAALVSDYTDGTAEFKVYSSEGSGCSQPNVSYVFSRCDLNCYASGTVSSCHMAAEYQIQKVKFNVTTYCH